MSLPTRQAPCHPNRRHFGKEMCYECYKKEWMRIPGNSERVKEHKRKSFEKIGPQKRTTYDQLRSRLKKFNLTFDMYKSLLEFQGDGCMICGGPPGRQNTHFSLDHDHVSGRF